MQTPAAIVFAILAGAVVHLVTPGAAGRRRGRPVVAVRQGAALAVMPAGGA